MEARQRKLPDAVCDERSRTIGRFLERLMDITEATDDNEES